MIWKKVDGQKWIRPISVKAFCVVETQSSSYTRKLVSTKEEHDALENIIEKGKPALSKDPEFKQLHYLLATPFRYPPLKHGSRFGTKFERSIWYGSFQLKTAFAEVAYYRFLFLSQSDAELESVEVEQTSYSIDLDSEKAIDLTDAPFLQYKKDLSHRKDYAKSQELGSDMRAAEVEFIISFSARDANGKNVGAFTPKAFKSKKPQESSYRHWHCYATAERVEFTDKRRDLGETHIILRGDCF